MTTHRWMELAWKALPRIKAAAAPRPGAPGAGTLARGLTRLGLGAACCLTGCNFAPKYQPPAVQAPTAFKELTPRPGELTNIWQVARPSDTVIRGDWWDMFRDPQLNTLEKQVNISNQNIAAAFANFLSARALVKEARAQLFPTLAANPGVTRQRQGSLGNPSRPFSTGTTFSDYVLPLDASWELDLWGRIRNTIKAAAYEAQATDADLQSIRLTAQAELAADYFQLRGQDALAALYQETVSAYQQDYELTRVRFQTGIASDEDVAQAETQLKTAQAQATNLGLLRAQLEHAIALLVGKPPAAVSLPSLPLATNLPPIPIALPSRLLERRPDIAAAERRVAEANARIGIAKAAYYPTVTLSASGGLESTLASSLLKWSSRFWSIGANLAETVFDAGLRKATVEQYRATYENTVAQYRQSVLTAFQQVEDQLSSLRILATQLQQQEAAVQAAEHYLNLANDRYQLGIDSYLNVITAQTTYLANRQTLVNLRIQQTTASVHLVEALGGGWETNQLPSPKQLVGLP